MGLCSGWHIEGLVLVIFWSEVDGSLLSFRHCQTVRPFRGELVLRKVDAVSGHPKCWREVFKDICSCSPKKSGGRVCEER